MTKQAKALRISRGSAYYLPRPVSAADLAIMRRLDRLDRRARGRFSIKLVLTVLAQSQSWAPFSRF
jgi:hypothetical protein